jgi:hypothetical protein
MAVNPLLPYVTSMANDSTHIQWTVYVKQNTANIIELLATNYDYKFNYGYKKLFSCVRNKRDLTS